MSTGPKIALIQQKCSQSVAVQLTGVNGSYRKAIPHIWKSTHRGICTYCKIFCSESHEVHSSFPSLTLSFLWPAYYNWAAVKWEELKLHKKGRPSVVMFLLIISPVDGSITLCCQIINKLSPLDSKKRGYKICIINTKPKISMPALMPEFHKWCN